MEAGPREDEQAKETAAAVERFSSAFEWHDVEGVMEAMTEDCVFENTYPPPDGERYVGKTAVREFWEKFFRSSPGARFETEETFVCGDRCVVRWIYRWMEDDGRPGHVRGIDVFRIREGRIAEKYSYVKG